MSQKIHKTRSMVYRLNEPKMAFWSIFLIGHIRICIEGFLFVIFDSGNVFLDTA